MRMPSRSVVVGLALCVVGCSPAPGTAEGSAQAALRVAKPREHHLTVFRAEWLRHLVARRRDPSRTDRHRLAYLRKLFLHLDQHEGISEIQDFKKARRERRKRKTR